MRITTKSITKTLIKLGIICSFALVFTGCKKKSESLTTYSDYGLSEKIELTKDNLFEGFSVSFHGQSGSGVAIYKMDYVSSPLLPGTFNISFDNQGHLSNGDTIMAKITLDDATYSYDSSLVTEKSFKVSDLTASNRLANVSWGISSFKQVIRNVLSEITASVYYLQKAVLEERLVPVILRDGKTEYQIDDFSNQVTDIKNRKEYAYYFKYVGEETLKNKMIITYTFDCTVSNGKKTKELTDCIFYAYTDKVNNFDIYNNISLKNGILTNNTGVQIGEIAYSSIEDFEKELGLSDWEIVYSGEIASLDLTEYDSRKPVEDKFWEKSYEKGTMSDAVETIEGFEDDTATISSDISTDISENASDNTETTISEETSNVE